MTDAILTRAEYAAISKERDLTVEIVNECVEYNPVSGLFLWKNRPRDHFPTSTGWRLFQSRSQGMTAGTITSGYVVIKVFNAHVRAHRLAWFVTHGEFPPGVIDHIDGHRSNNAIRNLRSTTILENRRNTEISKRNTSGHTGVVRSHNKSKPWRALIYTGGRTKSLGYYENKDDAVRVRKAAEKKYGFHENHGRNKVIHAEKVPR